MKSKLKISLIIVSVLAFLLLVAGALVTLRYLGVIGPRISKKAFIKEAGEINIPIVEINYRGSVSKTKEYTSCSFSISNCKTEEYNFSKDIKDTNTTEGGTGIRIRGNTTSVALKKSYRIRFNEKTSLFGLRENKSWVLLAEQYDQSHIRNYAAFTLAKEFNALGFTPTPHHVALFVNGSFKGLYLLCEQIDEEKGRLNIEEKNEEMSPTDQDFPLHFVIDEAVLNDPSAKNDYFKLDWADVELKYPDYEDRQEISQGNGDPVFDYAKEYLSAVFETIKTGKAVSVSFSDTPVALEDLVDIDSMIDYYLVNEILLNCDSNKKSLHLHKKQGGKLMFGPVWDFDWSLDGGHWDLPYDKSDIEFAKTFQIANRSMLFSYILKNEHYYNMIAARFMEKRDAILKTADMLKDYKATIKNVAMIDANKWHGRTGTMEFTLQYDYVRLFLYDRYEYLSYAFSLSHEEFLKIK